MNYNLLTIYFIFLPVQESSAEGGVVLNGPLSGGGEGVPAEWTAEEEVGGKSQGLCDSVRVHTGFH